jgi:hypothetical protein
MITIMSTTTPITTTTIATAPKTNYGFAKLELESYNSCKIWLEGYNSQATKKVYKIHLSLFCKYHNIDPDSLIGSIRNDPAKYSSLIYNCNDNMSIPTTTTTNSSYMYGRQQQHYIPSQDYFIEHYTAMLVEEAEKLYTKLVKDLTNRVVSDMVF